MKGNAALVPCATDGVSARTMRGFVCATFRRIRHLMGGADPVFESCRRLSGDKHSSLSSVPCICTTLYNFMFLKVMQAQKHYTVSPKRPPFAV